MNPRKLEHQHAQEQTALQQNTTAQEAAVEFATPEAALRHDAAQTELPPALAKRLKKSIEQEPRKAAGSWWKRLFGG